ncbi:metalloprotease 1 [Metarhizium rileyi]|uniref:Metalloprotease 1 n=1 Tax=Metarhizium rileyi (strain RCEF 4871) TaxID=1649241 RepID=A0A166Y895_METRR|nr:metalloprotease 1 [Metarhizium rileyi RCEF 4871]
MLPRRALLSLLTTVSVKAVAVYHDICGDAPPSGEYLQVMKDFRIAEAKAGFSPITQRAVTHVRTYVHVIAADKTYVGGYVDPEVIDLQMKVLNDGFSSTGYQFSLQNISYTYDSRFADIGTNSHLTQFKGGLRQGEYSDLNIYYFRSITDNYNGDRLTGWCNYPDNPSNNNWETWYLDGCNLHTGTLPGGSFSPYNQGKITIHEVGHWMGLIHPWGNDNSGGCYGIGDEVDDTPAQDTAAYGCQIGLDSCRQPGVDPIHNFMGYSDNSCVYEFTNGQITRMANLYQKFRV